jgi:predicted O-methyltransferase YrrM
MPSLTTTTTTTTTIDAVLDDLERSGVALGDNGQAVDIRKFAISTHAGRLLERAAAAVAAKSIAEVGCASARSTLHLARGCPDSTLHVMDPKQTSHWKGIGRRAIERAGIADRVTLHERCAHAVLPELLAAGTRLDFAFIDGWHMLDYVMVEAHSIDLMLNTGGVIAIHDLWMPALQHFSAYWVTNRNYEPVTMPDGSDTLSTEPYDLPMDAPRRGIGDLRKAPRAFTDRIAPRVDRTVLLLRKTGDDTRKWDDFTDYAPPPA